jgi:hypothetical protein
MGTTRIATLAVDQDRLERAVDIVDVEYSLKKKKKNSRYTDDLS